MTDEEKAAKKSENGGDHPAGAPGTQEPGGSSSNSRGAPHPVQFRVVRRRKLAIALLLLQSALLVLFASFVDTHVGRETGHGASGAPPTAEPLRQDDTPTATTSASIRTTARPRGTKEDDDDPDHWVPSIRAQRNHPSRVSELADEGFYPFEPSRDGAPVAESGSGDGEPHEGESRRPATVEIVDERPGSTDDGRPEEAAATLFRGGHGGAGVRSFRREPKPRDPQLHDVFPLFQDVHVMIFVGFGFLMTFLKRYGYSAVGVNMLLGAVVLQWATLCQGFFHLQNGKIHVDITSLLNADFASATVLISFGALLGKTSPLQLLVMAIFEIAIFAANEWVGAHVFWTSDIGASVLVHVFGAYFGLMVSLVLYRRDLHQTTKEGAVYHSDVFAMIGTIFLWLFWPSFNAAMAPGHAQHRTVINTYYSLAACCVTTFAISSLVDKHSRFNMVHVQNSTLAGGVAIGTAADLMIEPWGAMLVGSGAAIVSVLGYRFITPFMAKHLRIHDSCGVHNLHGMPGIFAGIVGAIMASMASEDEYGKGLYQQYPMRAPAANTTELVAIQKDLKDVKPGAGWSAHTQGGFQLAALCMTLGVACVGGLITGVILRLPFLDPLTTDQLFDDEDFWEIPEEEPLVAISSTTTTHGPGHKQQDSKV